MESARGICAGIVFGREAWTGVVLFAGPFMTKIVDG